MADVAGGKILLYEFTSHFIPRTNDCEFLFCVRNYCLKTLIKLLFYYATAWMSGLDSVMHLVHGHFCGPECGSENETIHAGVSVYSEEYEFFLSESTKYYEICFELRTKATSIVSTLELGGKSKILYPVIVCANK